MATRTIAITEVKANLLKLVTEIGETGDEIVITRHGREVAKLTPLETKLLWILAEERGRTLTREQIFERIWGGERPDGDRSVDVLVRRLRRKVDEGAGNYTYIQTELRKGYRLAAVPRAFPLASRRR